MSDRPEGWEDVGQVLSWSCFLRTTGNPETLEKAADAMERVSQASRDPHGAGAVKVLRTTAKIAREMLGAIEDLGYSFDFDSGAVRLPTGRPSPPIKVLSLAIYSAFRELALPAGEPWYTPETYQAIRDRLTPWLSPAAVEELSDATIRRAVERWLSLAP